MMRSLLQRVSLTLHMRTQPQLASSFRFFGTSRPLILSSSSSSASSSHSSSDSESDSSSSDSDVEASSSSSSSSPPAMGEMSRCGPYRVQVEQGKDYWWCVCGKSKGQPFCDGSHTCTEFEPVKYTARVTKTASFCGCRRTSHPGGLCDGKHKELPEYAQELERRKAEKKRAEQQQQPPSSSSS